MLTELRYERNRIVAHFKDGTLLKGYTQDFIPQREIFTVTSAYERENISEVNAVDLKAVFFVKSFEGNKDYVERKTFDDFDAFGLRGLKIKIIFFDGEIIRGMSFDYSKHYRGFFLIPVDPKSNNEMIYVVSSSLVDIAVGTEAEK
jgi:hypothetical protein